MWMRFNLSEIKYDKNRYKGIVTYTSKIKYHLKIYHLILYVKNVKTNVRHFLIFKKMVNTVGNVKYVVDVNFQNVIDATGMI